MHDELTKLTTTLSIDRSKPAGINYNHIPNENDRTKPELPTPFSERGDKRVKKEGHLIKMGDKI